MFIFSISLSVNVFIGESFLFIDLFFGRGIINSIFSFIFFLIFLQEVQLEQALFFIGLSHNKVAENSIA